MAEVTAANKHFEVVGARRVFSCRIATLANGDTLTTGLVFINSAQLTPGTSTSIGATVSGGVLTFATGGTVTNTQVLVEGL